MAGNEEAARLFSGTPIERTTGNEQKLKYRKLNLNARKCGLMMRMVKPWSQLPREDSESHQWAYKNLAGHDSRLHAVGDPAGAAEFDWRSQEISSYLNFSVCSSHSLNRHSKL